VSVAGDAWRAMCVELAKAGDILDASHAPSDELTQATGLRYLLNLVNSGLELSVFGHDPLRPEVTRPQDPFRRWGLDCPDALYGGVALDGRCTYRITGGPGSPHYLGISVTAGRLGTGSMRSLANLSSPGSLVRDDEGGFELVLGPEVDDEQPNHIRLSDDADHCSIRQFFADWDSEVPCLVRVDRLDAPPPPRVETMASAARDIASLASFVTRSATTWDGFVTGLRERARNVILPINLQASTYGGTPDNCYGSGYVSLEADQAAIVSFRPPPCHYWNVQIGDHWFQSLDYTYRQSALNHHQAVVDDDGLVRLVVAHDDPGVANWLDTGGHSELPLTYRFQLPAIDRADLPTPTLHVIGRGDLDGGLPATTRRVDPAERAEVLARRRRAVLERFRR
jgi:hypothetical protein